MGEGAGFDLTALNAYWWHPGPERMALARMPHRRLSAPFPVHCLELQARLDAALARQAGQAGSGSAPEPEDGSEDEADAGGGGGSSSPAGTEPAWELDTQLEVPVTADGQWNAVAFWFDVHAGHGSGAVVTSWGAGSAAAAADGEASRPAAAHSWDQAVQYVDSLAVAAGGAVRLRVRQDSGQLVFTTTPPQCRPRHALGEPGLRGGHARARPALLHLPSITAIHSLRQTTLTSQALPPPPPTLVHRSPALAL